MEIPHSAWLELWGYGQVIGLTATWPHPGASRFKRCNTKGVTRRFVLVSVQSAAATDICSLGNDSLTDTWLGWVYAGTRRGKNLRKAEKHDKKSAWLRTCNHYRGFTYQLLYLL